MDAEYVEKKKKYLSQSQGEQEQETEKEDKKREKMRSDEELESLVRRNAWNSELQVKGMLRWREQGTSEPWK